MNTIEGWFDGACEPYNPGGHASYGVVLRVNNQIVVSEGFYLGFGEGMSNNVAEYAGCAHLLRLISDIPQGNAIVYGDSKLVIYQLTGTWGVRGGLYVPYYREAKELADKLRDRVRFIWIPRERNTQADYLSKQLLYRMTTKQFWEGFATRDAQSV